MSNVVRLYSKGITLVEVPAEEQGDLIAEGGETKTRAFECQHCGGRDFTLDDGKPMRCQCGAEIVVRWVR